MALEPEVTADQPAVVLLRDPTTVATAATASRRALLAGLDRPDSATGLARRLGAPRQRVNYHLRELERLGLVELVEERPRRGLVERVVRRAAAVVLVEPGVLGAGQLPARDRSGALGAIAAAAEVVRDVTGAAAAAADRGQRLVTTTLDTRVRLASPAAAQAFLDDLAVLCARYDQGGGGRGLRFRIVSVLTPEPPEE